jgi:DNA-directed RNA polymerase subunit RPC12/RpoP
MNIIEAINCFEPINFEQKKNNEQIYFQLCQSCFWCASRFHLSSEENKHLAKCPYCNEVRLKSLPLTNDKTLHWRKDIQKAFTIKNLQDCY